MALLFEIGNNSLILNEVHTKSNQNVPKISFEGWEKIGMVFFQISNMQCSSPCFESYV